MKEAPPGFGRGVASRATEMAQEERRPGNMPSGIVHGRKQAARAPAADGADDNERMRDAAANLSWKRHFSACPDDAVAVIEPAPVATNQGPRSPRSRWRLYFRPRLKPFGDPLTGWTGGADPLAHVTLSFASPEAAETFCSRQGIPSDSRATMKSLHNNKEEQ